MNRQGLGCIVLCAYLQAGAAWAVGGLAEKALRVSLLGGKRACVKHDRARMMGQVGFRTINKINIQRPFVNFVFIGAGWLKAVAAGGTRFNPWCCCGRLRVSSVSGAAVAIFQEMKGLGVGLPGWLDAMLDAGVKRPGVCECRWCVPDDDGCNALCEVCVERFLTASGKPMCVSCR